MSSAKIIAPHLRCITEKQGTESESPYKGSVQNDPEVHFPWELLTALDRTGLTFPIERPLSFQHLLQIILTEKRAMLVGGECKIITVTRISVLLKTWAPNQQALIRKLRMLDTSSLKTTVSSEKVKSYPSFISLIACLEVFSLCSKTHYTGLKGVQGTYSSSLWARAVCGGAALRGCPSTPQTKPLRALCQGEHNKPRK